MGEDTPRADMYQLYRAADRTSPPAPVMAQAGCTHGLKPILRPTQCLELHSPDSVKAIREAAVSTSPSCAETSCVNASLATGCHASCTAEANDGHLSHRSDPG